MQNVQAVRLTEHVYAVGAVDYDCRSFHGYATPRGVTYNAYLITGPEPILIDTVKAPFTRELLDRIASVLPPESIRHIISNHAEFDHSGAIAAVAKLSGAKVYASAAGVKALSAMYGALDYVTLAAGKPVTVGGVTLTPYATPMVHWPDNIVTLCEIDGKKILFSNDAFGQHYASSKKCDVENDLHDVMYEAEKYYANIVMPYAAQAAKALAAAESLAPDIIAPSHGVVWTKHIPDIFALYRKMTAAEKSNKAVVVYDSLWGHTVELSRKVGAWLEDTCDSVLYFDLGKTERADVMAELVDAKYLAVGCPTFYGTVTPEVAAFLAYLKALKPTGLAYTVFGSYGWGGGAVKEIDAALSAMGYAHMDNLDNLQQVY